MVQFNTRANEILLKLVYYGPGLSGKTTNLQVLHAMCMENYRGEMFSVNTQEDRTLFFDLLPINLGYIYGNAVHLQIYTVPGQVQYDASRRVVLGGADGVVFVADSSEAKMQENVDSLSNLYHNLNANRLNIKQIPFVMQYNKRDLPDAMPVGLLNRRLNFRTVPYFESVAVKGVGVLDTFLSIARETVGHTFKKYHLDKKIKDFDEMLNLIESNIRANMRELPQAEESPAPQPEATVLRHSSVSVADLQPGKVADAQDLLEDALKSNMETARLYSELKAAKDALEKKNEEMNQLYVQLDRANQDNLKTRRYLEGLIQSVGEAIISFSADGRILTWNTAAENIFGHARSEIVGRTFQQLTPQARQGELEQAIAQVSKGQVVRDIQTTRIHKTGTEFPVSITYAPIRGADDKVLAFSAMVRDLRHEKDLERRLLDTQTRVGLGGIAPALFNDLANRLNPVLLHKDALISESQDPSQQARLLRLFRSVESVQALLRPLVLAISPGHPRLEQVQVNQIIQDVAKRLEAEAAAAGIALEFTLAPDLPLWQVDPDQVREAFTGLLRHGLFASARSSRAKRLRIGTRAMGGALQVVVQDTGPAIPESEQAHLFSLEGAKDFESLGLSVVGAVARSHGGRVTIRSQEGAGNAILIEFPVVDTPAPAPRTSSLKGLKVLVVDDEPFLLECLVESITAWGCDVTSAAEGQAAVQALGDGTFDLIVTDMRMPGLTGQELHAWVQAHRPELARRMLFTTGDSFDPDTRTFLDGANLPHLGKPFDLKKLRQTLEDLAGSTGA